MNSHSSVIGKVRRLARTTASDTRTLLSNLARRYDVIFFSGAPIDEVWIRSTYRECARRGMKCLHVTTATRRAARVVSAEPATLRALRLLRGKVLVTASSGFPAAYTPTGCKHVIHMPHSLVSLHMVYPENAFDGYTDLFACGEHHVREIAAIDKRRGIRGRGVHEVGYGKSDIMATQDLLRADSTPTVVIAPSWGVENVGELLGRELIDALLTSAYRVTLRPHPTIIRERPHIVEELTRVYRDHRRFQYEDPSTSEGSLAVADVMVSDYSGVAIEFAFARLRPVVYVDVARKVRNPSYEQLGLVPLEVHVRNKLGVVVPAEVKAICEGVAEKLSRSSEPDAIEALRSRYAYNWGTTGHAAADMIETMV